jgi:hypothetical protein
MKGDDLFGSFIKEFRELKESAEKEGNEGLRQFAKIMLNSCYWILRT